MKRHQALEPFSRDHYSGLVVAKHLQDRPGPNSVKELLELWENELADHFREEENLLSPLATVEMADKLIQDHQEIASMVDKASTDSLELGEIIDLGKRLHDHIRWEERELFPALERASDISSIEVKALEMEKRRQEDGYHQRRAELVNRRKREKSE
ncbi:MAG TPA: hypothetical protein DCQ94_01555 [Nitrospira sp.]|nr:hypothetical protein [Nitrospira sp.]